MKFNVLSLMVLILILLLGCTDNGDRDYENAMKHYVGAGDLPINFERTTAYLRDAALKDNAKAQYKLGYMYEKGEATEGAGLPTQSYSEAAKWYLLSAANGNFSASTRLSDLYMSGKGVKQSNTESFRWMLVAAKQGSRYAQMLTGSYYYYGTGVSRNTSEAAKWIIKSAQNGYPEGQYSAAVLFDRGEGVYKNYEVAYFWACQAAKNGNSKAVNYSKKIEAKMTKSQIIKVQKYLSKWKPGDTVEIE